MTNLFTYSYDNARGHSKSPTPENPSCQDGSKRDRLGGQNSMKRGGWAEGDWRREKWGRDTEREGGEDEGGRVSECLLLTRLFSCHGGWGENFNPSSLPTLPETFTKTIPQWTNKLVSPNQPTKAATPTPTHSLSHLASRRSIREIKKGTRTYWMGKCKTGFYGAGGEKGSVG